MHLVYVSDFCYESMYRQQYEVLSNNSEVALMHEP